MPERDQHCRYRTDQRNHLLLHGVGRLYRRPKRRWGKCQFGSSECNAARRYAYSNSDSDTNRNTYTDRYSNSDADPNTDRYSNTDANRNSNTDSDIHANTDSNS